MTQPSSQEVTQMLIRWSDGDRAALDELTPIVYDELRRLARHYMSRERPGHTLQTTALVNEAYLRLVEGRSVRWQNRAHFFAVSAQVMRHILIDHARSYGREKRGGALRKFTLDEAAVMSEERAAELLALDDALSELALVDERKSLIVELRYLGGLNHEETAEVLKTSPATVRREWSAAKAWLYKAVTSDNKEVVNRES